MLYKENKDTVEAMFLLRISAERIRISAQQKPHEPGAGKLQLQETCINTGRSAGKALH